MVCGRRGGGRLAVKFLKRLVAKPYNSLHARPSRYVPDLSVGNLWYKDNISRMPRSWRFHVAFCRTNSPPMGRGGIRCVVLFRLRGNSFSVAHAKVRSDLKSLSCLFEAKIIFFISFPDKRPPCVRRGVFSAASANH